MVLRLPVCATLDGHLGGMAVCRMSKPGVRVVEMLCTLIGSLRKL